MFKALMTAEFDEELLPELEQHCDVTIAGWGKELRILQEEELIEKLEGMDILITSYDDVTKKVIDESTDLRLIACTRSNPVNIDHQAATAREIPVVYTPGRNSDSTAEFTMALMLNIAKKIPIVYQELKNGRFLAEEKQEVETKEGLREDVTWALGGDSPYVLYKGTQLKGKTLGIVGFGDIGRRVARLAQAFGMDILVYDPYLSEVKINDNVKKKVTLEQLLEKSDFITSHVKITEETNGMFDQQAFNRMKHTAYFINASRGAAVDEEALIRALREKDIAGAALDVYASEPLSKEHPFITELDNIVITPHLGGATYQVLTNHSRMIIENIERFVKGEKLIDTYN